MSERFIPEHRRTQFKAKNTFKPDELRRRREEQQVEIRKQKREEGLAKRRGIVGGDGTQTSVPGAGVGASPDSDDEGGTIESQVCIQLQTCIVSSFGVSFFGCLQYRYSRSEYHRYPFDNLLLSV